MAVPSSAPASNSAYEIQEVPDRASLDDMQEKLNEMVEYLNFFNKFISLSANFSSAILEIKFGAAGASDGSDTRKIEHLLGVIPKYRIILRQTGNGVLEDIPSGWNNKFVTIKNRGTEAVTATIMIVRE